MGLLRELLPWLLVGVVLGWGLSRSPGWLAMVLIRWGVPFSLAALLLRTPLSATMLRAGLLGLVVPLLSLLLVVALPFLRQRLLHPVLRLGAVLGNTGYWGLPVAMALFPPDALATAATYDVAGTLITWSVGPLLLLGRQGLGVGVLRRLSASPACQGLLLALLLWQTPWRVELAQALWWPARGVFLLALVLVGMQVGVSLRQRSPVGDTSGLPLALGYKLVVVPALVWLLAGFLSLSPLERGVLVLQGAAPTALSVLLMAEAEQVAAPLASTLVLCTTLAALVTVPLWWSVLR